MMDEKAVRAELEGIEDHEAKRLRAFALVQTEGAIVTQISLGYPEHAYFDLDEVPAECPWQIGSRDPQKVIADVFGPLAEQIPTFVRALAETCRAVVAERTPRGEWRLLYYLQRDRPEAMCARFPGGSQACTLYMGGAPAPTPRFGKDARLAGWEVPSQVCAFAAVHDGFGPEGLDFGVESILPVHLMTPLDDQHPEWLQLRCDSVGNRRLLTRDRGESLTIDWDHETGEVAEEIMVFHWLDEHVAMEILDLDRFDFPNGPYDSPDFAGGPIDDGGRFDAIKTKATADGIAYYAVDFESWRASTSIGRAAVSGVFAASDGPVRRCLDAVLSMTTRGRLEVAFEHIVDADYVAKDDTDDCAHSWALDLLCLATGRIIDLDGLEDVLEIIDDKLRTSPLEESLPFGLPSSDTGVPSVAHATSAGLEAHVAELATQIHSGAFGNYAAQAEAYRLIIASVAEAGLGIVYIGW